ncbi:RDD family protein [Pseudoalteromonas tunicata]|jgi:uncharacterized RDD family membrane protein YckC|uniref:RDD domain-containing protein n=1 Tax=Pseudoalteromonas tunicata D2 TaxID=87626 RepID=A4CAI8_9GAMM|nr:RDD family protein [Pseudoalteromonas tunicata]ATC94942.1 hypothetical protein PTUN_a2468 [Pseudoalteromonas tunicata]AXT30607.1 RDD family protein [Pseudoalteromonas tunicata]EAR28396.1 hypothetical protein PTD2_21312 [Pseudoalteromonas tunicata D2]
MNTTSTQSGYYQAVSDTHNAGFMRRALAHLIDGILLSTFLAACFIVFYGDSQWLTLQNSWSVNYIFYEELLPLVLAVAFWVKKAATPGKMVMNTKVVDANTGLNISTSQALLRYISYFISALPLGLGFIWILIDEQNRAWHDLIAGTVVVKQA